MIKAFMLGIGRRVLLRLLFLISIPLFSVNCFEFSNIISEEIIEQALVDEFPDKGIYSLKMQTVGYQKAPDTSCQSSVSAVVLLCDAEQNCAHEQDLDKFACVHKELKSSIGDYESQFKEGEEGEEGERDPEHIALKQLKEIFKDIKKIIRNLEKENKHDNEHSKNENRNHNSKSDENPSFDVLQELNEVIQDIARFKEQYSEVNQRQIWVEIDSIDVYHVEKGWERITEESIHVNIDHIDLNQLLVLNALEPARYSKVRLNFGDDNKLLVDPTSVYAANLPPAPSPSTASYDDDDDYTIKAGTNWDIYPLVFADASSTSAIVTQSWRMYASKTVDMGIGIDIDKSIYEKNGIMLFKPFAYLNEIKGDDFPETTQGAVTLKLQDTTAGNPDIIRTTLNVRKVQVFNEQTGQWVDVIDNGEQGNNIYLDQSTPELGGELGSFQLEQGTYNKLRLVLNDTSEIQLIENGAMTIKRLSLVSAYSAGIILDHSFDVAADNTTALAIEIDVAASISPSGEVYVLNPDIDITKAEIDPDKSITRRINAEHGGSIYGFHGISLNIAPGALAADTDITISMREQHVRESQSFVGHNKNFDLTPHNLQFNEKAQLVIDYDPREIEVMNEAVQVDILDETMFEIRFYNPELKAYGILADQSIDTQTNTVTANIEHFSSWSLVNNILKGKHPSILNVDNDYKGKYRVGSPFNVKDFASSMAGNEVPGYCSAGLFYQKLKHEPFLGFIIKLLAGAPLFTSANDIYTGSILFFHACQRHDKCDNSGYASYGKTYKGCNDRMWNDTSIACSRYTSQVRRAYGWGERIYAESICRRTREAFNTAVRIPEKDIRIFDWRYHWPHDDDLPTQTCEGYDFNACLSGGTSYNQCLLQSMYGKGVTAKPSATNPATHPVTGALVTKADQAFYNEGEKFYDYNSASYCSHNVDIQISGLDESVLQPSDVVTINRTVKTGGVANKFLSGGSQVSTIPFGNVSIPFFRDKTLYDYQARALYPTTAAEYDVPDNVNDFGVWAGNYYTVEIDNYEPTGHYCYRSSAMGLLRMGTSAEPFTLRCLRVYDTGTSRLKHLVKGHSKCRSGSDSVMTKAAFKFYTKDIDIRVQVFQDRMYLGTYNTSQAYKSTYTISKRKRRMKELYGNNYCAKPDTPKTYCQNRKIDFTPGDFKSHLYTIFPIDSAGNRYTGRTFSFSLRKHTCNSKSD